MGKRDESTIENRVYLFESLANAFVQAAAGDLLEGGTRRKRALEALAELARVSCVVADGEALDPDAVAGQVAGQVPRTPSAPRKKAVKKRRARS